MQCPIHIVHTLATRAATSLMLCTAALMAAPYASAQDAAVLGQPIDARINGTRLDEAGLQTVFSGITHNGAYDFNREGVSTKKYRETTLTDGTVKHRQGFRWDHGDWDIRDDNICFEYKSDPGFGACFHIYKLGNCYFHYPLGDDGTDSYWSARSVIAGERPDCEPQVS